MRFDELDIPEALQRGVAAQGFTELTKVQEQAIPVALGGRDVAAQAQTGTGKTAAFLIALYTRLLNNPEEDKIKPVPWCWRQRVNLVAQIASDAKALAPETSITLRAVYGGVDYEKQRSALASGVDIIVATPGRLIDYAKQKVFSFDGIEVLVIDEADRMFDMGFIKDLRYILRRLPGYDKRQTMVVFRHPFVPGYGTGI